jgi:hypothetical protein
MGCPPVAVSSRCISWTLDNIVCNISVWIWNEIGCHRHTQLLSGVLKKESVNWIHLGSFPNFRNIIFNSFVVFMSDVDLYYGGEALTVEQPQAFTCPYCGKMGFTETTLQEHVTSEHSETSFEVVSCRFLMPLFSVWVVSLRLLLMNWHEFNLNWFCIKLILCIILLKDFVWKWHHMWWWPICFQLKT